MHTLVQDESKTQRKETKRKGFFFFSLKYVCACLCHTQYVRSEMAALVPALWSKLRELSGMQCQMETNTVHETTNQTDRDSLQQQQVLATINH